MQGGCWHRFESFRRSENIAEPRRSVVARVLWLDDNGHPAKRDTPVVAYYCPPGGGLQAEPEYPTDKSADSRSRTEVSGTYRAPPTPRTPRWNFTSGGPQKLRLNGAIFL